MLRLISEGDEQAFKSVFNHYRNRLYAYALRITEKEELAEEIVQDAFLKIWMHRTDLAAIERFDSYLYTVIRNQAFNALKRIAHEAMLMKELSLNLSELHNSTEEVVIHNDFQHLLHQAVNQLPPQQKMIYTLSRNQGLKYEEIAFQLNLSRNTVKAHLKKAMSTIRFFFTNNMVITFFCLLFVK